MLCSHCGKKIKANADKCKHCGTIFFETQMEPDPEDDKIDYVVRWSSWLGIMIVTAIPGVGLITLLLWSLQKSTNSNLQAYSRAALAIQMFFIVIAVGILCGTDISQQVINQLSSNPVVENYRLPIGWSYVTDENIGTLDSFQLTPMGFTTVSNKLYVFAKDDNHLYCFETKELKESDYWDMSWCATESLRLIGRKKNFYNDKGFSFKDVGDTELIPAPITEEIVFYSNDIVMDYQLSKYLENCIELSEEDVSGRIKNFCRDNKIDMTSCIVIGVRMNDTVLIGNTIADAMVPCAVFSVDDNGKLNSVTIIAFGYRKADKSFTNTGSYYRKLTPDEIKTGKYISIINSYYSHGIVIADQVTEDINKYTFEEKVNNLLTSTFIIPEDYEPQLEYVDKTKYRLKDSKYGEVTILLDDVTHMPSDLIYQEVQ